jgi:hypothetical protein
MMSRNVLRDGAMILDLVLALVKAGAGFFGASSPVENGSSRYGCNKMECSAWSRPT